MAHMVNFGCAIMGALANLEGAAMRNPIPALFEASGMTVRKFSEVSGIKYGTAYDLVKGRTSIDTVSVDVFLKAARSFGMTADEMLAMTDDVVDVDEIELITMYRSCDETQKAAILAAVRGIVNSFRPRYTFSSTMDVDGERDDA